MDKDIVLYDGNYWSKNDGDGVTETYASPNSSCFGLTQTFKDVPKHISEHVPKKRVVVQAGGNTGFYVKQYAKLFETVYTFEPVPILFYCLTKNVTTENVFKFQACLGDCHQLVDIGRRIDNNAGSGNIVGHGKIPTMRIDDLVLEVCDLIHLDIEGYEHHALLGGIDTIKRCKPVIVLENYAPWLQRFGTSIEQIESLLKTLSYTFYTDVQGDRVYKYSPLAWIGGV
jgi:FkbM family methyltransferase